MEEGENYERAGMYGRGGKYLRVSCPACRAASGEMCRDGSGDVVRAHRARTLAARRANVYRRVYRYGSGTTR